MTGRLKIVDTSIVTATNVASKLYDFANTNAVTAVGILASKIVESLTVSSVEITFLNNIYAIHGNNTSFSPTARLMSDRCSLTL